MKLSVIILNYNVRHFLELCLQSVERAITNIEAEIIVVDNASVDESCTMVRLKFPKVRLISNPENVGFSKGNNIGVQQAKGAYVCILNPDTVVAEDTFITLMDFAEQQNNLGIVGCKLIDGTGRFLPESKRNLPTPMVALKKLLGFSNSYYARHLEANTIGEVTVLVGAFMLLKRDLYNHLQGFDEDFFMYGEDIDLSYRAAKLGFKNYYYGATAIIHFKGESTLKDRGYARRFFGAMKLFYQKHFKRNLMVNLLVYFGIKLAYFTKSVGRPKINCPSTIWFYGHSAYLQSQLGERGVFHFIETGVSIESGTTVIFDANTLSFKNIITLLIQNSIKRNTCFKILPKKVNFILGSHASDTQGKVMWLKDIKLNKSQNY